MELKDLKVGDRVDRYHGDGFFMEMEVVELRDNLIVCAAVHKEGDKELGLMRGGWTFDNTSGVEEDEYMQWGMKFGATGSYLKIKEKP